MFQVFSQLWVTVLGDLGKSTCLCGLFILSYRVAVQLVLKFFSGGTVPYAAVCVLYL